MVPEPHDLNKVMIARRGNPPPKNKILSLVSEIVVWLGHFIPKPDSQINNSVLNLDKTNAARVKIHASTKKILT
jgi:hypothetical protein